MKQFTTQKIEIFDKPIHGEVSEVITSEQHGRVKFQGSYWPAKIHQHNQQTTVLSGQLVTVVGREGITLLVRPLSLITR